MFYLLIFSIQTISDHIHYMANVTFTDVLEAEKNFYNAVHTHWKQHNFLTARWWFLVALSIIPVWIWWKFVNKKRLTEITAFGLYYGVAAIILDSIGSNLLLWAYPVRITPYLYPQMYPYDVGVIIIPYMLVYQKWGDHLNAFIISSGIISLLVAFVAEPGMVWLGMYQQFTWKHIYSFPIYWLLALICRTILTYFKKLEQITS